MMIEHLHEELFHFMTGSRPHALAGGEDSKYSDGHMEADDLHTHSGLQLHFWKAVDTELALAWEA